MSIEEASSTDASTPMETSEAQPTPALMNNEATLSNGIPDNPDIVSRAKQLVEGAYGDNIEEVLNETMTIVESFCGPHLPSYLIDAVHFMTNYLIQKNAPIRGIAIVDAALSRLHHPGVLTSVHSDLIQLCLASKCLSPALKFLDTDVSSISENEEMDVRYVLQYFYYGGCVYAALKKWARALHLLEICLSVPNQQTTSAIQVVAYQKYSLVSILCGRDSRTLSHTAISVSHTVPYLWRPYTNLLQIAKQLDADKFAATIAQMTPFLEKHNNLGLAKQALEHIRQKNIEKFQLTFTSLSLASLSSHLKLPVEEVEARLSRAIVKGVLSASICKREGVVWFTKQHNLFNEGTAIQQLQKSLNVCMSSYEKAKELHTRLSLDPKLLTKIAEMEHSKKDSGPTSWDFPVHGKTKKILSFLE